VAVSWLRGADAIINFAKLKTHGMMAYSGAVKNLFGTIPGTLKLEYHFSHPDATRFADMLVDLNEFWRCRLSLVDAVVGMEGNGPTAGSPREVGVLLASPSPYALDAVAVELMGLSPKMVPTVTAAAARGLGPESAALCDVPAEVWDYRVPDYQLIETGSVAEFQHLLPGWIGRVAGRLAPRLLTSRPAPRGRECIGCEKCKKVCPAHAITMKKKRPVIDRSACIRCFCCQEFCPVGAMISRPPLLNRLLLGKK
jgi:ferredoxin